MYSQHLRRAPETMQRFSCNTPAKSGARPSSSASTHPADQMSTACVYVPSADSISSGAAEVAQQKLETNKTGLIYRRVARADDALPFTI